MADKKEKEETKQKTLAIHIDGWMGRVIAMSGAITEIAKKRPVKVITSYPLVFWGNPHIVSVHWVEDRRIFEDVISWNDYIQLEPYTDPKFFNDWVNWLDIAAEKLGLDKPADPVMFLAEHEKLNMLDWPNPILFQPFGSSMWPNGADRSYRSIRPDDAQYIANWLISAWFTVYVVEREEQPKLQWCRQLTVQDLRWLVTLANRYPVLGCDSSMHHAAKAFWAKAVVVWSWTDAGRFGYTSSINLRYDDKYTYVPFRLGVDFALDTINQHTNIYPQTFLDKIIKTTVETFGVNNMVPMTSTGMPCACMPWMWMPVPMWMKMPMWVWMKMPY